jgi:hypothetical protein
MVRSAEDSSHCGAHALEGVCAPRLLVLFAAFHQFRALLVPVDRRKVLAGAFGVHVAVRLLDEVVGEGKGSAASFSGSRPIFKYRDGGHVVDEQLREDDETLVEVRVDLARLGVRHHVALGLDQCDGGAEVFVYGHGQNLNPNPLDTAAWSGVTMN